MSFTTHIDKIVDNHAAQITQPQLPCNFLRGDDIHLEGRLFGVVFSTETAAVHVNRHEGLGLIDDQ